MFHRHKYHAIERIYAPPTKLEADARMSELLAERLLFGQTTIVFQCSTCSKITTIEAIGKTVAQAHSGYLWSMIIQR